MTFLIFKIRVFVVAVFLMAVGSVTYAQDSYQSVLENLSKLKRWEAMCPDSVQPKMQMVLVSLNYAVQNPQDAHVDDLLKEAEENIEKMKLVKGVAQSDIYTLTGFLYMVRIVQNPAQNGQRYYLEVMEDFEKALKLNPNNELAKVLQQKFFEGMRQATHTK